MWNHHIDLGEVVNLFNVLLDARRSLSAVANGLARFFKSFCIVSTPPGPATQPPSQAMPSRMVSGSFPAFMIIRAFLHSFAPLHFIAGNGISKFSSSSTLQRLLQRRRFEQSPCPSTAAVLLVFAAIRDIDALSLKHALPVPQRSSHNPPYPPHVWPPAFWRCTGPIKTTSAPG